MDYHKSVASLSMPLPEDITKRKWSGDIEGAIRAIDLRLQTEITDQLRLRLVCERERLLRLPTQYPMDREAAIAQLMEMVPGTTAEDFDRAEALGMIDFIYVGKEKRYFVRCIRSLAKTSAMQLMRGEKIESAHPWLDPMIAEIKQKGSIARRITMEMRLQMTDSAFRPGRYEAWMPFPAETAQQSEIRLLAGDPDYISDAHAPSRTAHFTVELEENKPFSLRYSFVSRLRYADPLHKPAPEAPLYPDELPVTDEDLMEDGTFIRFTPYLRSLAADLTAGCATPVEKAWAIYDFVTGKVKYSFVRDYFQIDEIGEYCALNLKGDCGLQALCFIVLCRIAGIPARWQSGLDIAANGVGHHDWAQFWLEGWGWLFADCSFGGSAFRCGAMERREYYFGNLDPVRMAANRVFMAELDPPMQGFRYDPYDVQGGEILYLDRAEGDPFLNGRQRDDDGDVISIEVID